MVLGKTDTCGPNFPKQNRIIHRHVSSSGSYQSDVAESDHPFLGSNVRDPCGAYPAVTSSDVDQSVDQCTVDRGRMKVFWNNVRGNASSNK